MATELPLPPFYDPAHAAEWSYGPDQQALFEAASRWRREHDIRPASRDRRRVHLLLVDLQKDFCFPEGSLYVGGRSGRGAIEDDDRVARFIYRNLGALTAITCTLDTHHPYHIFSPAFWLDESGRPPSPHREVTLEEVRAGALRPDPALADWLTDGDYDRLRRAAEDYCRELERTGKYRLYLWPPHCILGSDGHALAGVIHEARLFHAYARASPAPVQVKGETPLTEFYSVLGPEVAATQDDGGALARHGEALVEELLAADALLVAGQAASHCVKATLEDLQRRLDRRQAGRVYILRDCMSSVAVPDPGRPGGFAFDFTPEAEAALERFEAAGMHVVESTVPMHEWPGMEKG